MPRPTRRSRPGRVALLVAVAVGATGLLSVQPSAPVSALDVTAPPSDAPLPSTDPGAPSAATTPATASPAPVTATAVPPASTPKATTTQAETAEEETPEPRPPYPNQCLGWAPATERADLLLDNRYRINTHPTVTIPADPSWTENPLDDANWEYQFHSQWLVLALLQRWQETGDQRYLDKASFLLRDWVTDNPRTAPRSIVAWDRMGTALRAQVLACAWRYLPHDAWLADALDVHGATLADPAFYANEGNWALNQNLGLLEVALVRERADWKTLAATRLTTLFESSVDSQGVTNEQSVWYQFYNWDRYRIAFARFEAAGIALPASAARHDLMPGFLALATLPNGQYEMIGDTDRIPARVIRGTTAEFAATRGASGPKPPTVGVYRAGWLFARSGWGERRPYADEIAVTMRWGPGPIIHGHADGGSVTVYGYGSRLIVDPGKYTYNWNAYRAYFKGRTAHNVVTVDRVAFDRTRTTKLLSHSSNATMVTARVQITGNPGVTHVRGLTFSRRLNYVIVEDRLSSATWRTYRQLWHLSEDARPLVYPTWFRTQRTRGNVQVRQLLNGSTSRVLTGRTSPVQGWLAYEHGVKLRAPVVEVIRSGRSVRYLTLIVTAAGTPASGVSELRLTSTGYRVKVKIGSKYERVVVDGTKTTITPLN